MTAEELKQAMIRWELNAAQLARVLCLHSNRLSEYLAGVSRIPCALAYSVEVLELLPPEERRRLFEKRLQRSTHGR